MKKNFLNDPRYKKKRLFGDPRNDPPPGLAQALRSMYGFRHEASGGSDVLGSLRRQEFQLRPPQLREPDHDLASSNSVSAGTPPILASNTTSSTPESSRPAKAEGLGKTSSTSPSTVGSSYAPSGRTASIPIKTLGLPKTALYAYYGKKPQHRLLSAQDYYTWSNQGPPHQMKFTSCFLCPLTGEAFFTCPFGTDDPYVEETEESTGATVFWYNKKKLAENGAAARAYDCLSFRKGGAILPYGRAVPYNEGEAPTPPSSMPMELRQRLYQTQARIRENPPQPPQLPQPTQPPEPDRMEVERQAYRQERKVNPSSSTTETVIAGVVATGHNNDAVAATGEETEKPGDDPMNIYDDDDLDMSLMDSLMTKPGE